MNTDNRYLWQHKDLLDCNQLSCDDVFHLLDLARSFQDIHKRPVRKIPTLQGRTVVLFFVENSTRTKTSFDVAGKRLSADTHALSLAGSSLNKGESLLDTGLTLEAMHPDVIVVRHSSSGTAEFLAKHLSCGIVNAGDGWHAHPTQALLDCYSLRTVWGDAFAGKTLLILGDIAHSRVARSNVVLWTKLGVSVRLAGPRTLLPPGLSTWPVTVFNSLDEAIEDVDAVMCLRLQLERQQAGLLPSLAEYSKRFCLTSKHMAKAKPDAVVLHPGPLNRGLEIADGVADSAKSLILNQVQAGVCVRMAILYLLATRK
ncbi:MAG: aspartate carbamoyltransferase catalytic subunit [Desulfovibrio sp.]|nr:aspartate carbamoyltransferase catalytic subunit [Desulfovibrio sp.]